VELLLARSDPGNCGYFLNHEYTDTDGEEKTQKPHGLRTRRARDFMYGNFRFLEFHHVKFWYKLHRIGGVKEYLSIASS
jgi:hypothetical protein